MLFTSSTFLFAFMPLFFVVYFLLPWRAAKNIWLLVASLVFYAWGEPVYIALMVASIAVNWLFGLLVSARSAILRRAMLVIAVAFNIAVIGFFKYEGFLAHNINAIAGMQIIPNLELPLPIGISFLPYRHSHTSSMYIVVMWRHNPILCTLACTWQVFHSS